MVNLSSIHRERTYFHLGYGNRDGIDAGDVAQCEEAFTTIRSNYMLNRVLEQLDICDESWDACRLTRTEAGRYTTRELFTGDLNRSILRDSSKDNRVWWDNYLNEGRQLAQLLWVPFYRDEGQLRYRYERSAQAFIRALPGCADVAVSSSKLEFAQLGGSFGY